RRLPRRARGSGPALRGEAREVPGAAGRARQARAARLLRRVPRPDSGPGEGEDVEVTTPAAPVPRGAFLVWGIGVLAYVVAVLNRSSLGVAGLLAADRFHASASAL